MAALALAMILDRSTFAKPSEFYVYLEVLSEITLFLLAKRREVLESDG
jgi:hypothetical protein